MRSRLGKGWYFLLLAALLSILHVSGCREKEDPSIGIAVEFMDHAACAYISRDKGWFEEAGLRLDTYESYVTGMALASALARGDIEVAYICLVPAISVYANAGVPIKIVAGTHKYGYGLVVDPKKINTVKDLEKPGIRLGCVREGGAVDMLLHRIIDEYQLDKGKISDNLRRMNPTMQVLAMKTGQLDAVLLPEQWATMAEEPGFEMLLESKDVWPEMQGSVLVVRGELLEERPEVVEKLVGVSRRATDWLNHYPGEAAEVVARQLRVAAGEAFPTGAAEAASELKITPEVLLRSMARMEYTLDIDPEVVQETIDYMARLGYIKKGFAAREVLDLRFFSGE
ncbi:ABC transporter substrate-binding protein [Chloroflexota bacterium]